MSGTTPELGVFTVWPENAHKLYSRKVLAGGVTTWPQGKVTLVVPLYQCCSALGTLRDWPGTTLAPRSPPVLAPEGPNGKPPCHIHTPLVCQPLTIALATRFWTAKALPRPTGRS